jgi:hypothetical protein
MADMEEYDYVIVGAGAPGRDSGHAVLGTAQGRWPSPVADIREPPHIAGCHT